MRNVLPIVSLLVLLLSVSRSRTQDLGEENLPALFKAVKRKDEPAVQTVAIGQLAQFGLKAAPALPELLDALQSRDEGLRLAAAVTLGKIGKQAVEPVAKLLRSDDAGTRFYAVWTLGFLGKDAQATFPAVAGAMTDKHANVRRKAAFALARIGGDPDKTMALLATALADGDNDVVEAAGEALARFGKAAVPTLIGLLKSDPPSARWQAAASLGTIGPEAKEAVPALKDRLLDKDTAFAKHYATELAKIGPASLTALQAGFRDERGDVREAAAEGLELLGADAVPFLLDNLREKRLDLRRQAALSLMRLRLGDRQVVLALAAGLADEDSVMRKFCINGLAAAGPNAAPAKARILDALRDFHPHVRGQAATILGTLGENVDEILERGLKSKDARIRLVYGTLMMERSFNDQRPLRPLNDGIDEKAPALRVQAVFGLSRNGTRVDAWIPILVAGLKHQDAGVRVQAARGLSAIGEVRPGADIALAEVLSDPDSEVRYFAVHALRLVIVEKKALAIIARQFNEGDADRRIVMLLLDENRLGDLAGKFRRSAIMDKNERVRRAGLEAIQLQIRGVGPLPHLEELAVLARDEKVEIRIQIAPLLQNGGEKCVPLLIELLKDRDTQVRLSAISTLTAMDKPGKTAVPALETALNDPDRQIRLNAMHAVVKVAGLKDALPALRAATKDGYGLMRVQALHTLTHAGTEKPATLVPPLIDCLKDPDAGVRLQAIYALHFLGAESAAALPRLRELGKSDSDETVRRYAGSVTAPYIESMLLKKQ